MSDGPVLSLSTRAGDRSLSLQRQGDEVVIEVDAVAGCGTPRVEAPSPVGVGVSRQGGGGADADVEPGGERAIHVAQNINALDQREMGLARSCMNRHTC
jgi:hypothetical protein